MAEDCRPIVFTCAAYEPWECLGCIETPNVWDLREHGPHLGAYCPECGGRCGGNAHWVNRKRAGVPEVIPAVLIPDALGVPDEKLKSVNYRVLRSVADTVALDIARMDEVPPETELRLIEQTLDGNVRLNAELNRRRRQLL